MRITTANVKKLSKVDQIGIQEIKQYRMQEFLQKVVLGSLLHANKVVTLKSPIIHTRAKRRWKSGGAESKRTNSSCRKILAILMPV